MAFSSTMKQINLIGFPAGGILQMVLAKGGLLVGDWNYFSKMLYKRYYFFLRLMRKFS